LSNGKINFPFDVKTMNTHVKRASEKRILINRSSFEIIVSDTFLNFLYRPLHKISNMVEDLCSGSNAVQNRVIGFLSRSKAPRRLIVVTQFLIALRHV
jgi:hypothetical protein